MAKTIEQLQAFIDTDPDIRQLVNEITDYLQANPSGNGGSGLPSGLALKSYQNSTMSAPVMAYVFRDADDNIFRVYEPLRNNEISRNQFAYNVSIDLFPFDSADCYNSKLNDVKLLDVGADVKIQNSVLADMVIDSNSTTGLSIISHIQQGSYGAGTPNGAEIHIVGNTVLFSNNRVGGGLNTPTLSNYASFFDQVGANTQIYDNTFGNCTDLYCEGKTGVVVYLNTFGDFGGCKFNNNNGIVKNNVFLSGAYIDVRATNVEGCILFNSYIDAGAEVKYCVGFPFSNVLITGGTITRYCSFGVSSTVNIGHTVENCTIGDNVTLTTAGDIANKNYSNINAISYELAVTAGAVTATPV